MVMTVWPRFFGPPCTFAEMTRRGDAWRCHQLRWRILREPSCRQGRYILPVFTGRVHFGHSC